MYLDEIQDWVAISHDLSISKSSLDLIIRDAGFSYKMLSKAAAERDEVAREAFKVWAKENLLASMIVTADESSKDGRTIFRKRGRAPSGQRAISEAGFVRGDRYSLLAAIVLKDILEHELSKDLLMGLNSSILLWRKL